MRLIYLNQRILGKKSQAAQRTRETSLSRSQRIFFLIKKKNRY
jgi:hypothetical protein